MFNQLNSKCAFGESVGVFFRCSFASVQSLHDRSVPESLLVGYTPHTASSSSCAFPLSLLSAHSMLLDHLLTFSQNQTGSRAMLRFKR